jgi:UDP-glucose 4-epimerase
MRIAVTGANGFVGRSVIQAIRARGHYSIALVRDGVGHSYDSHADETELIGDIGVNKDLQIRSRFDVMIHLASRAHVLKHQKARADDLFRLVNVLGTKRLLNAAKLAGAKRFVFMSSIKVNGERSLPGMPFTVMDQPNPEDAYGRSKLEAELIGAQLSKQLGVEWIAIRPPLVFGRGARGNLRLLSKIVKMGIPLPLGSVVNRRSMIHVDNLSDLTIHCCESRMPSDLILAGDGTNLSIVELINAIGVAEGAKPIFFRCPLGLLKASARLFGREHEVSRLTGTLEIDHSEAESVLGWRPPIAPSEALLNGFG